MTLTVRNTTRPLAAALGLLLAMAVTMVWLDISLFLFEPWMPANSVIRASALFADRYNSLFMGTRSAVMFGILALFICWAYAFLKEAGKYGQRRRPPMVRALMFAVPLVQWFVPIVAIQSSIRTLPSPPTKRFYFWWAAWIVYTLCLAIPTSFAALMVYPERNAGATALAQAVGRAAFTISLVADFAEIAVTLTGLLFILAVRRRLSGAPAAVNWKSGRTSASPA